MGSPDQINPVFEKHSNPFLVDGLSKRIDEIEAALENARKTNPELYERVGRIINQGNLAPSTDGQYQGSRQPAQDYPSTNPLTGVQPAGNPLNVGSIREQITEIYEVNEGQGFQDAA